MKSKTVRTTVFGTCQTTLLCLGLRRWRMQQYQWAAVICCQNPPNLPHCFRTRHPCVNVRAWKSVSFRAFIRSMWFMLEWFSENLAGLVSNASSRVRTHSWECNCLQMVTVLMRSSLLLVLPNFHAHFHDRFWGWAGMGETWATIKAKTVSFSVELHTLGCPTQTIWNLLFVKWNGGECLKMKRALTLRIVLVNEARQIFDVNFWGSILRHCSPPLPLGITTVKRFRCCRAMRNGWGVDVSDNREHCDYHPHTQKMGKEIGDLPPITRITNQWDENLAVWVSIHGSEIGSCPHAPWQFATRKIQGFVGEKNPPRLL